VFVQQPFNVYIIVQENPLSHKEGECVTSLFIMNYHEVKFWQKISKIYNSENYFKIIRNTYIGNILVIYYSILI